MQISVPTVPESLLSQHLSKLSSVRSLANMTSHNEELFNCYATLGVSPYAEEAAIQEAYDQKIKLYSELDDDSPEATALTQNVWHNTARLGNASRDFADRIVLSDSLGTHTGS